LPTDTPLTSLTDDQLAGLCMKFDDFFSKGTVGDQLKDFNCRLSGILAGALGGASTDDALRAACKVAYDACVAAPSETTSSDCTKPTGTCTATIGDVEACTNDSAAYLEQVQTALPSCDELTVAGLGDLGDAMQTTEPASCTTLDAKCPDAPSMPGM
jgi:hypothetical protein